MLKIESNLQKKLHEIFQCGHQKGLWVDKNHKEKSKFSDIRLIFWHFSLFFLTRIITPWNKKKCSKGYAATIFITGYYYWRINFFFQNRLTSGWDTAKFFLEKKAPTKWQKPNLKEIFKIVRMCFLFWKIVTSKNQKLRFSNMAKSETEIFKYGKHYFVPSFLSISWVRCFGLMVKAVNFKTNDRGFKPPSGKNVILKKFFCFVFRQKLIYSRKTAGPSFYFISILCRLLIVFIHRYQNISRIIIKLLFDSVHKS